MNIEQICWLRELVVPNLQGQDTVAMEFSCDNGYERTPLFFPVKAEDLPLARALYSDWGGNRPQGYRIGTAAKGPCVPLAPSVRVWKQN